MRDGKEGGWGEWERCQEEKTLERWGGSSPKCGYSMWVCASRTQAR